MPSSIQNPGPSQKPFHDFGISSRNCFSEKNWLHVDRVCSRGSERRFFKTTETCQVKRTAFAFAGAAMAVDDHAYEHPGDGLTRSASHLLLSLRIVSNL